MRDGRSFGAGPYLRAVRRAGPLAGNWRAPRLPLVKWLTPSELDLSVPATFFAGENGTGKSTLLEAIAVAAGFAAEVRPLSAELEAHGLRARPRLASGRDEWIVELRTSKPRGGFLLRAESCFNVAAVVDERELDHALADPARPAGRTDPGVRRRRDPAGELRRAPARAAAPQLPRGAGAVPTSPAVGE